MIRVFRPVSSRPSRSRSYDGRSVDLGAPGKRTVLWFTPKAGLVDDFADVLGAAGH